MATSEKIDKTELELNEAAAMVQAEAERRLKEFNAKIEVISQEYGYEIVARVTVAGVTIPVPVTCQRKG